MWCPGSSWRLLNNYMRQKDVYLDIDLNFPSNIYSDVARKRDMESVRQGLKNVVMIDHKPCQPDWGAGIHQYLFEPIDPVLVSMMRGDIRRKCAELEPRARIESIDITPDYDDHSIKITIWFYAFSETEIESVDMVLERSK